MNKKYFWNAWSDTPKFLFQTFLLILGAAIVYYFVGYFWSSRLVIQWETISHITSVPMILDSWWYHAIPLNITLDQYLISQIFEGSDLELTTWPAILLLLFMAAGLVLTLSLAVDLSRFWFLVSQVVFIFTMVGFQLEQLLLFNRTDKAALILAFLLYLPASYYFHAVKKDSSLTLRLVVFGLLTILFGLVVNFYSGVSHPFLYLVEYGIPIPMVLTVIFILLTAHEVIYGLLVLITRSNTPKSSNSFAHFLVLSLIYLGNVLFIYLKNTSRIEWDLYHIDAFWLLIAAGLIGIWGLRQRGELFKNIMPVEPHALLGYLSLAAISFATIGYFFATANDPAIEALEDAVVFGHLSIGFIFLIYILFNFREVLIANLKVFKVVYKPKKMPFFSMRLAGLIGVLGLFLLANQYPLDQAITAYYNGIGDLHRQDHKMMLAKEYYKLAAIYAKSNHRSNYAIAAMARSENDLSDALAYFKQSTIKQPTPYAFVNAARSYEEQGMYFKAMFTLKDGLAEFPHNPYITNNLAALYARTEILDSAYYFLETIGGGARVEKVAETNRLGLLARSKLDMPVDSIMQASRWNDPEVSSNLLLMANELGQSMTIDIKMPNDTLLNPLTFAWWYNYNLNRRFVADSSELNQLYELLQVAENELYSDNLHFIRAVRMYYSGNIAMAFYALRNLQFKNSSRAGFYNDILGQWSLQQNQPRLALDYFIESERAGHLPAVWHKSLALVSLGDIEAALANWKYLADRTEVAALDQMREFMRFLNAGDWQWESLNDHQKCWYMQINSGSISWETGQSLLEEIQDPTLHFQQEQWLWDYMLEKGDSSIQSLEGTQQQQAASFRRLQLATVKKDTTTIRSIMVNLDTTDSEVRHWTILAKAMLAEHRGAMKQAESLYQELLTNPFFERGILEASRFLGTNSSDDYRTYEILLEALEVNKYSVRLLKAYGIQCTKLNLDTYRQTTLALLQELVTHEDYESYLSELAALEHAAQLELEALDTQEVL